MGAKKDKIINKVSSESGWSLGITKEKMSAAKELGVIAASFLKHECWKMTDEEIEALGKKLKAEKEERIAAIVEASGWSREKVETELSAASKIGITSTKYLNNECWNMSSDELEKFSNKLKKDKVMKAEKQARKEAIAKETGWSMEKVNEELSKSREVGVNSIVYLENECWKMDPTAIEELGTRVATEKEEAKKLKEEALAKAKELGITKKQYEKYNCAEMTEEELIALGAKLTKQREKRAANIVKIVEASGLEEEKVKEELKKANDYGITSSQYLRYDAWLLSDEELVELADVLAKLKLKRKEDNEFYVDAVARLSGWSEEKVIEEMEKEKEKGVSFLKYTQKNYFERSELSKEVMTEFLNSDKDRIKKNKEYYVGKVCEVTGWSTAKAKLEIAKARYNCGSSFEDFYVFKLYELTPEEQREYVTYGLFSKMRIKYNEYFTAHTIFDDKAAFNSRFADCIDRRWFVNENISYEEFLQKIDGIDAVLAKPLAATQGIGIQKFKFTGVEEDNKKAYEDIMGLETSIVEQYIVQHEDVMAFCDTSVNTLRITTLNANDKCNFLYAVFRMGRGAVVDNFHAGGIAASVDVNTGIVSTHAVDLDGNVYETNPYSGLTIKGFQIPNWDKIVEACEKIYNRVENVNLIGWDFAITPDGVDLIEGNPGASYVVAQIPNVPNRVGLRKAMIDPFL